MTDYNAQKIVLPLNTNDLDVQTAGGKGINLAKLALLGFPVPGGFIITTQAYRAYTSANGLDEMIQAGIQDLVPGDPAGLETASERIRAAFAQCSLGTDLASAISGAYRAIGCPPVAVRSSATAEDLPEMSFAGQQDTFLNITREDALLKAVVDCWSSLWTARAIGYRLRNHIPGEHLSLAVVVQEMVQSEASGVLFTANPVSGLRSETVIDATLGLGEALVSGQVEPDHYVVDTPSMRITHKTLGSKAVAIRSHEQGGTVKTQENSSAIQALADEQIIELAKLSQQAAGAYDLPQDIEWAWAKGRLYLLQSRAITSLYPLPAELLSGPLRALFSFGAVQGMLEPWTPLGMDIIRGAFAAGAAMFGYKGYTYATQKAGWIAGERLWMDITPLLRNTKGRQAVHGALNYVEPSVAQNLELVWNDPRLTPEGKGMRAVTVRRLAGFGIPMLGRIIHNWMAPEKRHRELHQYMEAYLAAFQQQYRAVGQVGDPTARLRQRLDLANQGVREGFPIVFRKLVSLLAGGMACFNFLRMLAATLPEKESADRAMMVTRGVPFNPTTEMDLALWDTARTIRGDPESLAYFENTPAAALAADYQSKRLPKITQSAVEGFMVRYGLRGFGEIDMGRPRWSDDPTHVFQVLGSFLHITDAAQTPDAVFERSIRISEKSVAELVASARRTRGGWFKAFRVRWLARRVRALLGAREAPKFWIVRLTGTIRAGMLESGKDLAEAGILHHPDDIFYLRMGELDSLANSSLDKDSLKQLPARVAERRAAVEREGRRRQIPRLLMSDGRTFYEGISAPAVENEHTLIGSPVSPGTVEGTVHVILDPRGAQLSPGEILVCPGTDPSWTPLFLAAVGLVMEVGGMMTHGAVVAREYGIPAVVGVHEATTRLKNGQRIRVDGSSGQILLL